MQAHVVRAMLEGICFQTREVVDAMTKDAGLDRLEVGYSSSKPSRIRALAHWPMFGLLDLEHALPTKGCAWCFCGSGLAEHNGWKAHLSQDPAWQLLVCRLQVLRVDGGASANDLLLQLQADLLQVRPPPSAAR